MSQAVGVMGSGAFTTVARHAVLVERGKRTCNIVFRFLSEGEVVLVLGDLGDDITCPDFRYWVLCDDGNIGILYHDELSL